MHDIDDQHSHVTETGATTSQVSKRLVTGRVNDQEAGNLEVEGFSVCNVSQVLLKGIWGEESCTDLLSDTTSLTSLHIGATKLIQNKSLARVYVTHHTNDRATQFLGSIALASLSFEGSLALSEHPFLALSPLLCFLIVAHVKRRRRCLLLSLLLVFVSLFLLVLNFVLLLLGLFLTGAILSLVRNNVIGDRLFGHLFSDVINSVLPIVKTVTLVFGALFLLSLLDLSLGLRLLEVIVLIAKVGLAFFFRLSLSLLLLLLLFVVFLFAVTLDHAGCFAFMLLTLVVLGDQTGLFHLFTSALGHLLGLELLLSQVLA